MKHVGRHMGRAIAPASKDLATTTGTIASTSSASAAGTGLQLAGKPSGGHHSPEAQPKPQADGKSGRLPEAPLKRTAAAAPPIQDGRPWKFMGPSHWSPATVKLLESLAGFNSNTADESPPGKHSLATQSELTRTGWRQLIRVLHDLHASGIHLTAESIVQVKTATEANAEFIGKSGPGSEPPWEARGDEKIFKVKVRKGAFLWQGADGKTADTKSGQTQVRRIYETAGKGSDGFGQWATPEQTSRSSDLRDGLAVLPKFKPHVTHLVKIRATRDTEVWLGIAGGLGTLRGGAPQVQMVNKNAFEFVMASGFIDT